MKSEATKKHDISSLNQLYTESDQVDQAAFAEMRSNVLLNSSEHYARKKSQHWARIRDSKQLSEEQKIRLTKNHIQKITKTYVNTIVSYAPGVAILPKTENERADQKAAELNAAVWADAKQKIDYEERVTDWGDDFVVIGEVATKVFFDPHTGPVKEYKAKVDPKTGEDMRDEAGNLIPGQPVFHGLLTCEDIYGFNLLRPKNCKNMRKAEWLGTRKMVPTYEVMAWVGHDEEKMKLIKPDEDKTYVIFDAEASSYGNSSNQILIKEFFFRPCYKYPQGYFFIFTEHGILFEGELPFGIFPIIVGQFDKVQTTPRGRSLIKVLRPYQIEINRAASKMAEHQITLGDDKILVQKGTQLAQAGVLPGIRGVSYQGKEPTILAGRDGSQYLNYHNAKVAEMYAVAMMPEVNEEKPQGQIDPWALLHRAASQRVKFSRHTKRFERFLIEFTTTFLKLAKHYYTDEMLVPAIGKREYINIDEFRSTEDLCYQIKLEAQSDDIETKFGKMMSINHTLQYVGAQLGKEEIGKLLKAMPYVNEDKSFGDFTLDTDTATNTLLALDRGKIPKIVQYIKKDYMVQRLGKRMGEADFEFLSPEIQQNYQSVKDQYEQMIANELEAIRAAQAGFIPTDGYMVKVQMYMPDPSNPHKSRLALVPYSSLAWLIKTIEKQGLSQDALQGIDGATQGEIAHRVTGATPAGSGSNGTLPFPPQRRGNEMPQGAPNAPNGYGPTTHSLPAG